ncbi:hypothetical protein [Lactobacillus gigeriorum]|uniref:Uncharacterized protein n=1 Tax=Lactobacillus gigeriorum DSM 23908 = CRBIP 24.85 TaxID=1423751 RepID=I7J3H6_9LACO|nr:hypothetical protein [Lactobacillus gigeriorum]KRN14237.1 hypothetical protein FC38_GL001316 [Lactobacillus gigeriorum DSM 23908 = CRBIP 24.85]CCI87652.1 Putative uncharacterized protein [Lactobacillus gigeriorum DSM 23908 = CRBIP 24.85]
MLYLLYVLIGLLIVLGVDFAVTAFWAIHDTIVNQKRDKISFSAGFKKYFAENNNIPTKMSDLFN